MACDSLLTASCQQTCCKSIVKTCYPQAPSYKLFRQVIASVQITMSCIKPDFNSNLMELTSGMQLVDMLDQAGKIDNFQRICGVLRCANNNFVSSLSQFLVHGRKTSRHAIPVPLAFRSAGDRFLNLEYMVN